jgi:hypothetical protein
LSFVSGDLKAAPIGRFEDRVFFIRFLRMSFYLSHLVLFGFVPAASA